MLIRLYRAWSYFSVHRLPSAIRFVFLSFFNIIQFDRTDGGYNDFFFFLTSLSPKFWSADRQSLFYQSIIHNIRRSIIVLYTAGTCFFLKKKNNFLDWFYNERNTSDGFTIQ